MHDGRKFVLDIGNFLDFRPEELVRTISLVIDFRLVTPTSGSTSAPETWTRIITLSSDIQFAVMFRYFDSRYILRVVYRKTNGFFAYLLSPPNTIRDTDFILIFSVSRSLANPSKIVISNNVGNLDGGTIRYWTS